MTKRSFLFYSEAKIKDMKHIIGSNTLLKCHLSISSTSIGQYCDKSWTKSKASLQFGAIFNFENHDVKDFEKKSCSWYREVGFQYCANGTD
jgi:hypothetical protein